MMVNNAMGLGTGDWNTHYFVIPPFVSIFLFLMYAVYFVVGSLLGVFRTAHEFAVYFMTNPAPFYLLGRLFIGAGFGTATVAAVYALGKRFFSKKTGFFGALFLTVAPLHVQHSHYIYADVPVAFVLTLVFYRLLLIHENPKLKNYLLLGALFGWAVAVKYVAIYFLPAVVLTHLQVYGRQVWGPESLKRAAGSALASIGTFALIAPYTFLDWASFSATFGHQSKAEEFTGILHHLIYSIIGGSSIIFVSLAIFGGYLLLRSKNRAGRVLIAGFLAYYAVSVFFSQHFARYMVPAFPFLALGAGYGWSRLTELFGLKTQTVILTLIFITLAVPTAYSDYLFCLKDTRTLALSWFEENIPQGTVVAVDNRFFSPRLCQSAAQIREKIQSAQTSAKRLKLEAELRAAESRKTYEVYVLKSGNDYAEEFNAQKPRVYSTWKALDEIGAQYLIFTSQLHRGKYNGLRQLNPDRMKPVKVFSPYHQDRTLVTLDPHDSTAAPHLAAELYRRRRLGPVVEIYRIDP